MSRDVMTCFALAMSGALCPLRAQSIAPQHAALRVRAHAPATRRATVQFIVTSDVHYGITRKAFRGESSVSSALVNAALIAQINRVSGLTLPADEGVGAGTRVGAVDFVAITGDIANRAEDGSETAAESWRAFRAAWCDSLTLRDAQRRRAPLYVIPGNHDISNAIGYYRPLHPGTDASSAAGMFNLMMHPREPRTSSSYKYATDRIHFGVNVHGVHLSFLNIWPDSEERAWLAHDIAPLSRRTPVLLFAHDPPAGDAKHFVNPLGTHDINATDRFENLLSEPYKDAIAPAPAGAPGASTVSKASTDIEQREFVAFLKAHLNVAAYFHGHNNHSEFYDYRGPDDDVSLSTIRVDSPMKGAVSASDETRLSFALVTIDVMRRVMTVREVPWNTAPGDARAPIMFGESRTVSIAESSPRARGRTPTASHSPQ